MKISNSLIEDVTIQINEASNSSPITNRGRRSKFKKSEEISNRCSVINDVFNSKTSHQNQNQQLLSRDLSIPGNAENQRISIQKERTFQSKNYKFFLKRKGQIHDQTIKKPVPEEMAKVGEFHAPTQKHEEIKSKTAFPSKNPSNHKIKTIIKKALKK